MKPNKKNRAYWKERSEMLEKATHNKSKEYIKALQAVFDQSRKKCDEKVAYWYAKIARNNDISLTEAKKLLNASELVEFQWDLSKYVKKAKENEDGGAWRKQLENASAKKHVSRYDALMLELRQAEEEMYAAYVKTTRECLQDTYEESYLKGLYEYGVKTNSVHAFEDVYIDKNKLDKILSNPWTTDGKTFSDRIWQKKEQLVRDLQLELAKNIALGKPPGDTIDYIAKKHDVLKRHAESLVQTETAFIHEAAQKDVYEELESEQYEILATLDYKTSEICQEMDGKIFDTKEFQVGATAPPFHPRCRTTTVPYDALWDSEQDEPRAYRDKDGKTQWTNSHLTYKEWKEQYVNADEEFSKAYDFQRKSNQNKSADTKQFDRYKEVLGKEKLPKTLEKFQEMKYTNPKKWDTLKKQYRIVNSYEANAGQMSTDKILELDDLAFTTKTQKFTGKARRKGNIAVMELDGDIKIANSQLDSKEKATYVNFKGNKEQLVLKKEKPQFATFQVGSHGRDMDSEAKLLEYAADIIGDGKKHKINLLSEKCMCDSCLGVLEQFAEKYPNVTVNAVSNKKERNAVNHGNPWKYR